MGEPEAAGGTTPKNFSLRTDQLELKDDKQSERRAYTVLTEVDVEDEIESLTSEVAKSLDLPLDVTGFLLRQYNWSKRKLLSDLGDDPAEVKWALKKRGLHHALKPLPKPSPKRDEIECPMCYDDVPAADCIALGCRHWFCRECFEDYLVNRVKTKAEKACLSVCPEQNCPVAITDDVVTDILKQPHLGRYREFRRRHYLNSRTDAKWCPSPGCAMAVKYPNIPKDQTHVDCTCGFRWCFECYQECHDPVTCDQLTTWLEKCEKESDTAHWIIANTRKCPKCFTRIEKNHGCNHMICTKCAFEFCWVCMGSWKEHGIRTGGFYKCNKYKEKKEMQGGPKTKAKQELDRFLHYYHRYHNHDQAKQYAAKISGEVQITMNKLHRQDTSSSWIGVQFLKDAADEVQRCRRILKYTYVYGYNLAEGPEKELFEFLQEDLEKNTEHLHGLLSQESVEMSDRAEISNFTRITAGFSKKLLEGLTSKKGLL